MYIPADYQLSSFFNTLVIYVLGDIALFSCLPNMMKCCSIRGYSILFFWITLICYIEETIIRGSSQVLCDQFKRLIEYQVPDDCHDWFETPANLELSQMPVQSINGLNNGSSGTLLIWLRSTARRRKTCTRDRLFKCFYPMLGADIRWLLSSDEFSHILQKRWFNSTEC